MESYELMCRLRETDYEVLLAGAELNMEEVMYSHMLDILHCKIRNAVNEKLPYDLDLPCGVYCQGDSFETWADFLEYGYDYLAYGLTSEQAEIYFRGFLSNKDFYKCCSRISELDDDEAKFANEHSSDDQALADMFLPKVPEKYRQEAYQVFMKENDFCDYDSMESLSTLMIVTIPAMEKFNEFKKSHPEIKSDKSYERLLEIQGVMDNMCKPIMDYECLVFWENYSGGIYQGYVSELHGRMYESFVSYALKDCLMELNEKYHFYMEEKDNDREA